MVSNSFCNPLRVAALCLCLASLFAQSSGHLTVGEPQKIAGKRGAALECKIPIAVDMGFHVNSNKPSDPSLIPLKLTWKDTGALEPGSVVYPKASVEKYTFAPEGLSVFTGNFDVMANFKVAANAPAGPGLAEGQLRYQACNSTTCFPPKTVPVKISYLVQ